MLAHRLQLKLHAVSKQVLDFYLYHLSEFIIILAWYLAIKNVQNPLQKNLDKNKRTKICIQWEESATEEACELIYILSAKLKVF